MFYPVSKGGRKKFRTHDFPVFRNHPQNVFLIPTLYLGHCPFGKILDLPLWTLYTSVIEIAKDLELSDPVVTFNPMLWQVPQLFKLHLHVAVMGRLSVVIQ